MSVILLGLGWVELSWVELGWVELSWVGLSWVECSDHALHLAVCRAERWPRTFDQLATKGLAILVRKNAEFCMTTGVSCILTTFLLTYDTHTLSTLRCSQWLVRYTRWYVHRLLTYLLSDIISQYKDHRYCSSAVHCRCSMRNSQRYLMDVG